jgi:hypothetical protein
MARRLMATFGDYARVWEVDGLGDIPMCVGRSHNIYSDDQGNGLDSLTCPCGGWRDAVAAMGDHDQSPGSWSGDLSAAESRTLDMKHLGGDRRREDTRVRMLPAMIASLSAAGLPLRSETTLGQSRGHCVEIEEAVSPQTSFMRVCRPGKTGRSVLWTPRDQMLLKRFERALSSGLDWNDM